MDFIVGQHVDKELRAKYTTDYYLGGIDAGRKYGAAGSDAFKAGGIDGRYARFLRSLPLKNKTVLDIGCGRGDIVCGAAKKALHVTGIDYSQAAVNLAKQRCAGLKNVQLYCANAGEDWERRQGWDIIFMLDVIEHIAEPEITLVYHKAYRLLHEDGILIIDTPLYESKTDRDKGDDIPATMGMHCNKQTRDSLQLDLRNHGFRKYSIHVWGKGRFDWRIQLYAMSIKPQTLAWQAYEVLRSGP